MTRYHINPEKGNAGKCSARPGFCPFGGEHQHYDSEAKAQAAFELSMAASTFEAATHSKPAYDISKNPKNDRPHRAYPERGDTVKIHDQAGTFEAKLGDYAGQVGVVEGFGGTVYRVRFDDGTVHNFNYQLVDFSLTERPVPEDWPHIRDYTRTLQTMDRAELEGEKEWVEDSELSLADKLVYGGAVAVALRESESL